MQIGNVWLKMDGFGSCIPLVDVTPAEVTILNENHEVNAKTKEACFDLTNERDEKRENEEEINRLREKYVNAKTKKGESLAVTLYPGKNPVLPQTFKEVGLVSVPTGATVEPSTKLSKVEEPVSPSKLRDKVLPLGPEPAKLEPLTK